MIQFHSTSPENTRSIGQYIGKSLIAGQTILLEGALGSGKTILAQGIADVLGITEPLKSPTYLYICPYQGKFPLYHIDLYRVEEEEFLDELGLRELVNGDGISIVEWGTKFQNYFSPGSILVSLTILPEEHRTIIVRGWFP